MEAIAEQLTTKAQQIKKGHQASEALINGSSRNRKGSWELGLDRNVSSKRHLEVTKEAR